MKKFKECVKCNTKKNHPKIGVIWLSEDGYCSVCNFQYKDRKRSKSIFEFKTIKEGEYYHLNKQGEKRTAANIANRETMLKIKGFNPSTRAVLYNEWKEKKKIKLDRFL